MCFCVLQVPKPPGISKKAQGSWPLSLLCRASDLTLSVWDNSVLFSLHFFVTLCSDCISFFFFLCYLIFHFTENYLSCALKYLCETYNLQYSVLLPLYLYSFSLSLSRSLSLSLSLSRSLSLSLSLNLLKYFISTLLLCIWFYYLIFLLILILSAFLSHLMLWQKKKKTTKKNVVLYYFLKQITEMK